MANQFFDDILQKLDTPAPSKTDPFFADIEKQLNEPEPVSPSVGRSPIATMAPAVAPPASDPSFLTKILDKASLDADEYQKKYSARTPLGTTATMPASRDAAPVAPATTPLPDPTVTTPPTPPPTEFVNEDRGFFGDVGSRIARGAVGAAKGVGGALQMLDADVQKDDGPVGKFGKSIVDWANQATKEHDFLKPDLGEVKKEEGLLYRGAMSAAESTPASLVPAVGGILGGLFGGAVGSLAGPGGTVIGAKIGAGIGAAGTLFGTFGLGTYKNTIDETAEKMRAKGTPEAQIERDASAHALTEATAEAGSEFAGDLAAMFTFGLIGKQAVKQGAKQTIRSLLTEGGLKGFIKDLAKTIPFEAGSEVGAAYLQTESARKYGLTDMSTGEAMQEAILPAVFMSMIFGGAVRTAQTIEAHNLYNKLNSEDIADRLFAVQEVTKRIEDKPSQIAWVNTALEYVKDKQEIPLSKPIIDFASQATQEMYEENVADRASLEKVAGLREKVASGRATDEEKAELSSMTSAIMEKANPTAFPGTDLTDDMVVPESEAKKALNIKKGQTAKQILTGEEPTEKDRGLLYDEEKKLIGNTAAGQQVRGAVTTPESKAHATQWGSSLPVGAILEHADGGMARIEKGIIRPLGRDGSVYGGGYALDSNDGSSILERSRLIAKTSTDTGRVNTEGGSIYAWEGFTPPTPVTPPPTPEPQKLVSVNGRPLSDPPGERAGNVWGSDPPTSDLWLHNEASNEAMESQDTPMLNRLDEITADTFAQDTPLTDEHRAELSKYLFGETTTGKEVTPDGKVQTETQEPVVKQGGENPPIVAGKRVTWTDEKGSHVGTTGEGFNGLWTVEDDEGNSYFDIPEQGLSPVRDVKQLQSIDGTPFREELVPIDKIIVDNKAVPNFKANADKTTGIVEGQELSGPFDELGTGPIILWERLNGDLVVATGRHRLDLAKRTAGKDTIKAHILREADGFTAEDASIADAEQNIKDQKGTGADHATYFRFKQDLTRDIAESRGLLSRAEQRSAWELGKNATDTTFTAVISDAPPAAGKRKLTFEQAAAISEVAPRNESVQNVGRTMAETRRLTDPKDIAAFLKSLALVTPTETGPTTGDLFGYDDSAINASIAMGKRARAKQSQLAELYTIINSAVKREGALKLTPEAALKHGITDINDMAQLLEARQRLQDEISLWKNWETHPELVATLRDAEPPVKKDDAPPPQDPLGQPGELKGMRERIDRAAAEADPNPSVEERKSGTYKKGHPDPLDTKGLTTSIETAKGQMRRAIDGSWEVKMPNHYGHVLGTIGKDKDQVDVTIGDNPESDKAFVIDQQDRVTKKHDEHKSFIHFLTRAEAVDSYIKSFDDGWGAERIMGVTEMSIDEYKEWLKKDHSKRLSQEKVTPPPDVTPPPEVTPPPVITDKVVFKIGERVEWTKQDGTVMTGVVTGPNKQTPGMLDINSNGKTLTISKADLRKLTEPEGKNPLPTGRNWHEIKAISDADGELTPDEIGRLAEDPTPEETEAWERRKKDGPTGDEQKVRDQAERDRVRKEQEAALRGQEIIRKITAKRDAQYPVSTVKDVANILKRMGGDQNKIFSPSDFARELSQELRIPNKFNYLAKILDRLGVRVQLRDTPYRQRTQDVGGSDVAFYSPSEGMVVLAYKTFAESADQGGSFAVALVEELMVHEFLHGIVRKSGSWESSKSKLDAFYRELLVHKKDAPQSIQHYFDHIEKYEVDEMISMAFSKAEFAQWLDSIPADGVRNPSKTLWGKLKDIIFGVLETFGYARTQLDALNDLLDRVIATAVMESGVTEDVRPPINGDLPTPSAPSGWIKQDFQGMTFYSKGNYRITVMHGEGVYRLTDSSQNSTDFKTFAEAIDATIPKEVAPSHYRYGSLDNINTVALSDVFERSIPIEKNMDKTFLKRIVSGAFGITVKQLNDYQRKSLYFHKQAEEAYEYALVKLTREMMRNGKKLNDVISLYNSQASLNERTNASKDLQQYSTPAPLAWIMNKFLGMTDYRKTSFSSYDPTGGNGGLLVGANPTLTTVNELDSGARLLNLVDMIRNEGGTVLNGDANEPSVKPPDRSQDRIITNPPFGSAPERVVGGARKYSLTKLEHQIVALALDKMKDDGKAAIIVGGRNVGDNIYDDAGKEIFSNKTTMTKANKAFLTYLYNNFNVTHNIDIDGKLYTKQGTGFPIRLITIDGRKAEEGTKDIDFNDKHITRIESADTFEGINTILGRDKYGNQGSVKGNVDGVDGGVSGRPDDTGGGGGTVGAGTDPVANPEGQVEILDAEPRDESGQQGGTDGGVRGGDLGVRNPSEAKKPEGTVGGNRKTRAGMTDAEWANLTDAQRSAIELEDLVNELGEPPAPIQRAPFESDAEEKYYAKTKQSIEKNVTDIIQDKGGADLTMFEVIREMRELSGQMYEKLKKYILRYLSEELKDLKARIRDAVVFQVPYDIRSNAPVSDTNNVVCAKNQAEAMQHALNMVEAEHGPIDEYVRGLLNYADLPSMYNALSGPQIDSLGLILHQFGINSGAILGDQTGVGKGRVCAAVIKFANLQGKIPVFVTANGGLFSDMMRDMRGISYDLKPFIMNGGGQEEAATVIDKSTGEVLIKANSVEAKGPAYRGGSVHWGDINANPEQYMRDNGFNAIFTTYSQHRTVTASAKDQLLNQMAVDNYIILDESHKAAGDAAGGSSNTMAYFSGILRTARGVLYSSATYAKTPHNNAIYFRTALGDTGMPMDDLITAIKTGGTPLQEYFSAALTKLGNMVRREMSWEGINFDYSATMHSTKQSEHPELYQELKTAFRRDKRLSDNANVVIRPLVKFSTELHSKDNRTRFDTMLVERYPAFVATVTTGSGRNRRMDVSHSSFASVVHNFNSQLLTAIKADRSIAEAKRAIDEGRKPIINLMNTMGSFLDDEIKAKNLVMGSEVDFTFNSVLEKAMRNTLRVKGEDQQGNEVTIYITPEDIRDYIPTAYRMWERANEQLERYDGNELHASPIDYIKHELSLYTNQPVGEITGRKIYIDYGTPENGFSKTIREREDGNRNTTIFNFNTGNSTALIMNAAGAEGISLHPTSDTIDVRPRRMLLLQPNYDIAVFIQAFGRIFRKGMLVPPEYLYILTDLPSEIRPSIRLRQKMASLKANTSAKQEGTDTRGDIPDMMNEYGNQVVRDYLRNNKLMAVQANAIHSMSDDIPDFINFEKVSGNIAILPVATQEVFFNEVEADYIAKIEELDARGENNLVSKNYDLKATNLTTKVLYEGADQDNPFMSDAKVELMDARVLRPPHNVVKIQSLVKESLGLITVGEANDYSADQISKFFDWQDAGMENSSMVAGTVRTPAQYNAQLTKKINAKLEAHYSDWANNLQALHPNPTTHDHAIAEKQAQIAAGREVYRRALSKFRIGDTYEIPEMEGSQSLAATNVTGVLTKITWADPKSLSVNPLQPGLLKFTFSVNNPMQTRLYNAKQTWFVGSDTRALQEGIPEDWDALLQTEKTEHRALVTGNMLQAIRIMSEIPRDQKIKTEMVYFSRADGTKEFGLLVARGRDTQRILELTPDQGRRATASDAYAYISDPSAVTPRFVSSANNHVTIQAEFTEQADGSHTTGFVIGVPQSTQVGSKYYQDPEILASVRGNLFRRQAQKMLAYANPSQLRTVMEILGRKHSMQFIIPVSVARPPVRGGRGRADNPLFKYYAAKQQRLGNSAQFVRQQGYDEILGGKEFTVLGYEWMKLFAYKHPVDEVWYVIDRITGDRVGGSRRTQELAKTATPQWLARMGDRAAIESAQAQSIRTYGSNPYHEALLAQIAQQAVQSMPFRAAEESILHGNSAEKMFGVTTSDLGDYAGQIVESASKDILEKAITIDNALNDVLRAPSLNDAPEQPVVDITSISIPRPASGVRAIEAMIEALDETPLTFDENGESVMTVEEGRNGEGRLDVTNQIIQLTRDAGNGAEPKVIVTELFQNILDTVRDNERAYGVNPAFREMDVSMRNVFIDRLAYDRIGAEQKVLEGRLDRYVFRQTDGRGAEEMRRTQEYKDMMKEKQSLADQKAATIDMSITFTDRGIGMLPQTVSRHFTKTASEGTKGSQSSGAQGIGKSVFLGWPPSWKLVTVARHPVTGEKIESTLVGSSHDYITGKLDKAPIPYKKVPLDTPTGTTFTFTPPKREDFDAIRKRVVEHMPFDILFKSKLNVSVETEDYVAGDIIRYKEWDGSTYAEKQGEIATVHWDGDVSMVKGGSYVSKSGIEGRVNGEKTRIVKTSYDIKGMDEHEGVYGIDETLTVRGNTFRVRTVKLSPQELFLLGFAKLVNSKTKVMESVPFSVTNKGVPLNVRTIELDSLERTPDFKVLIDFTITEDQYLKNEKNENVAENPNYPFKNNRTSIVESVMSAMTDKVKVLVKEINDGKEKDERDEFAVAMSKVAPIHGVDIFAGYSDDASIKKVQELVARNKKIVTSMAKLMGNFRNLAKDFFETDINVGISLIPHKRESDGYTLGFRPHEKFGYKGFFISIFQFETAFSSNSSWGWEKMQNKDKGIQTMMDVPRPTFMWTDMTENKDEADSGTDLGGQTWRRREYTVGPELTYDKMRDEFIRYRIEELVFDKSPDYPDALTNVGVRDVGTGEVVYRADGESYHSSIYEALETINDRQKNNPIRKIDPKSQVSQNGFLARQTLKTLIHELVHEHVSRHEPAFHNMMDDYESSLMEEKLYEKYAAEWRKLYELHRDGISVVAEEVEAISQGGDQLAIFGSRSSYVPITYGESTVSQISPRVSENIEGTEPSGRVDSGAASGGVTPPLSDAAMTGDYPMAGEKVDGRDVHGSAPNQESIDSSLANYEILKGIREVPLSDFIDEFTPSKSYSATENRRIEELSNIISRKGYVSPLIVVIGADGPYILEGGHRFDALRLLGAKSFPAMVVVEKPTTPPPKGTSKETAVVPSPSVRKMDTAVPPSAPAVGGFPQQAHKLSMDRLLSRGEYSGIGDAPASEWAKLREAVDAKVLPAMARAIFPVEPHTKEEAYALADAQRGDPESAMLKVTEAAGGGQLTLVSEHLGDLTHRMSQKNHHDGAGYEYVKSKVDTVFGALTEKYGFDKEVEENTRSNANRQGIPIEKMEAGIDAALLAYANAHSKLPTKNTAQKLAQYAAVEFGNKRWDNAISALEVLKSQLGSRKEWESFAHEGEISTQGREYQSKKSWKGVIYQHGQKYPFTERWYTAKQAHYFAAKNFATQAGISVAQAMALPYDISEVAPPVSRQTEIAGASYGETFALTNPDGRRNVTAKPKKQESADLFGESYSVQDAESMLNRLARQIVSLEKKVDVAYEKNDPNVEDMDVKLTDLKERFDNMSTEYMAETDISDTEEDREDQEVSLEEDLANLYNTFIVRNNMEYTPEAAIRAFRDAFDTAGAREAIDATDAEIMEAAKDAYASRQAQYIEHGARYSVEDKEYTRLAEKWNAGTITDAERKQFLAMDTSGKLELEDVQGIIKGDHVQSVVKDGATDNYLVTLKSGEQVVVMGVAHITPNSVALNLGYKEGSMKGKFIAGSYGRDAQGRAVIKIARENANMPWTIAHESVHWLVDLGIITKAELASIGAVARKEGTWNDSKSAEENQVDWLASFVTKEKPKQSVLAQIWQKIQDFINTLKGLRTPEMIGRELESGKLFGRKAEAAGTEEAKYSAEQRTDDATYMKFVNEGNMAMAGDMVDAAAKRAMPNSKVVDANGNLLRLQHETSKEFTKFIPGGLDELKYGPATPSPLSSWSGPAIWLGVLGAEGNAGHNASPRKLGYRKMVLFANITNPLVITRPTEPKKGSSDAEYAQYTKNRKKYERDISRWVADSTLGTEFPMLIDRSIIRNIEDAGYDGIEYHDTDANGNPRTEYVVFYPTQLKSAEDVTYRGEDDMTMGYNLSPRVSRGAKGEVIPLSERFDMSDPDSKYSLQSLAQKVGLGAKPKASEVSAEDVKSRDPEVQKRLDAADGLKYPTTIEKTRDTLAMGWEHFTRHFPDIDPKKYGALIDVLRTFQELPRWSRDEVMNNIQSFVGKLTKDERRVFTMNILLPDMLRDYDSGLKTGSDTQSLMFGYADREAMQRDADHFRGVAAASPKITKALKLRNQYIQKITDDMIKAKILRKDLVNDPASYFHHQVLIYRNYQRDASWRMSSADVRSHTKGFQMGRNESVEDININYVEAEFEMMAHAIMQIETAKTIKTIEKLTNSKPHWEAEAHDANMRKFYEKTAAMGIDDPLKPYRKSMAVAFRNLEKIFQDYQDELPPEFNDVIKHIKDQAEERQTALDEDRDFTPAQHPKMMALLQYLVDHKMDGKISALTIFKAISQRNQYIREIVGNDWQEAKPPQGMVRYKPQAGHTFYFTNSITDQALEQVKDGRRELPDVLRQVLALGQDEEWFIDAGIAKTLNDFRPRTTDSVPAAISKDALTLWKQWILINPFRVIKYNLNNMSGDLDVCLAYDGNIVWKYGWQAFKDLRMAAKGTASPELMKELSRISKLGVIGSGMTEMDIPEIGKIDQVKKLVDYFDGKRNYLTDWYSYSKKISTLRENVLRLAANRYFTDRLTQGDQVFGASSPTGVGQVRTELESEGLERTAAKLARELLGDYGNISHSGQWIRERMIPFYCVPDDAEMLTKSGWKTLYDLDVRDDDTFNEEVLTYNVAENITEWQPLNGVALYGTAGPHSIMTLSNASNGKFRFTAEHKWPVIEQYGNKRKLVKACDFKSHYKIPVVAPHKDVQESILSPLDAALLGWIVTDGYTRTRWWSPKSMEAMIYQSPKKHSDKIREMFSDYISSESVHPDTGVICFRLKTATLKNIRTYFKTKADLPGIVTRLDRSCLEAMYEAMMDADGCRHAKNGEAFGQKGGGPVLDAFQIICYLLGKAFNIGSYKNGQHAGYVKKRDKISLFKWTLGEESFSGYVWCPNTNNATWVMRQNGQVIITGNSWLEINAPRYVRLLRNLKYEEGGGAGAFGGVMAWKATKLGLKASALMLAIMLWNAAMFPDEEDELQESGREQLHMILGRRADGSIITLRFQGALSDALSWFGMSNPMETIKKVASGKKNAKDLAIDVVSAAPLKVFQGFRPEMKVGFEAITGQSLYPNPLHPRPIRDTTEHIMRTFSLDKVWNRGLQAIGEGKPKQGGGWESQLVRDIMGLVVNEADPGEQAYYTTRNDIDKWLEKQGKSRGTYTPTNQSNALYYYKQALKYSDFEAAGRYLKKYKELGGKQVGVASSIKRAEPLSSLRLTDRYKFTHSLSPEQLETLRIAKEWYKKHYVDTYREQRMKQP